MSKAERLAAARKKLKDFQKNKEKSPLVISKLSNDISDMHPGTDAVAPVTPVEQIVNSAANVTSSVQYGSLNPHSSPASDQSSQHESTAAVPGMLNISSDTCGPQQPNIRAENAITHDSNLVPSYTLPHASANGTGTSVNIFPANAVFDNIGQPAALGDNKDETTYVMNEMYSSTSHEIEDPVQTASHLFNSNNCKTEFWDVSFSSQQPTDDSYKNQPYNTSSVVYPSSDEMCVNSSAENQNVQSTALLGSDIVGSMSMSEGLQNSPGNNMYPNDVNVNCSPILESSQQASDHSTLEHGGSVVESETENPSTAAFLDIHYQKLTAELAAERCINQQLQFNLKECQSQVSHLEAKLMDLQSQQEVVVQRHLGPLQEQLRAHAQTVGILVGEKTELEAALAHHTSASKQHASEVEELQNRLRASRHRVTELEKELASVNVAASNANKQKQSHAQEVDRLRLENGMISKQLEDAEEEASELRQKLNARISEVEALEFQLQEKQSQLSLAQLRVTQLTSSDSPEASAELESLHQHNMLLERRCAELSETLRQLSSDRDQADQQYQQYVSQLNGQLHSLNAKIESMSVENERLTNREEELVRTMSELERQMQQQLQQYQQQQNQLIQHQQFQQTSSSPGEESTSVQRISKLEAENQSLSSTASAQMEELASLRAELEEREIRIAELEATCHEQPNQTKLLAAMESDKVAAAQATAQNTVLKQQLKELQDGFIKMSNDKLQLTENLEHEKHVNKEMGEKIAQLAEELHELRVLVNEKERQLQEVHSHDHDLPRHHNHDHDLLHMNQGPSHDSAQMSSQEHDHGHDHEHSHEHTQTCTNGETSSDVPCKHEDANILQEKLCQAKDHIQSLSSQNHSLRRFLAQKSTESHESGSSSSATEGATTDDATADVETNCDDIHNHSANYLSMQHAMEKLQERFTRTMAEVAELTDEKQRLEHLVLQLQGETETIGEYVALYQIQRALLQQRAHDKDRQLKFLAAEREDLRSKLSELNTLVCRLLKEKGLPPNFCQHTTVSDTALNGDTSLKVTGTDVEEKTLPDEPVTEAHINDDTKASTAGQILALLTEIGTSSLVDNTNAAAETFHPCPWCSGRLITV